MARNQTIKVCANGKDFPQARTFVEEVLDAGHANANMAAELMSLFEALFHEITSHVNDEHTELQISSIRKLGSTDIVMVFPGKRFSLPQDSASGNPDAKIIEAFSEKIACSYEVGYNRIQVSVSKNAWSFILPNLIAVVAAVIVGIVLILTVDDAGRQTITQEWVSPLENLFTNAMLMIGAPMTLFSLLKNVTDTFIVAEAHSPQRKLFVSSVASSLSAIAIALVMGFVFAQSLLAATGMTERVDIGFSNWSLAAAVDHVIPSSIVQPFETISPIPMIVVALLIAGALKSVGQSFNLIKRAIDACYNLFSGILQIVMAFFPLACFLLFLEAMLANDDYTQLKIILSVVVIVFVSTLPLLALYALRLKARGISVLAFARKLWPLVKDNFVIGSVIDAVPYNTRYCEKNFGISRDRLNKELPILAQASLDGNCFILMLLATIYIFVANCEVSWFNVAVAALIVVFLSLGAPNQPGSILIGMLVILTYLNSDAAISLALCFELFFGSLQNILNVISSVAMVAENERRDAA